MGHFLGDPADKPTLHLTSVKFGRPKMAQICLYQKRDFILKSIYLQKFLFDFSGRDVKIHICGQIFKI